MTDNPFAPSPRCPGKGIGPAGPVEESGRAAARGGRHAAARQPNYAAYRPEPDMDDWPIGDRVGGPRPVRRPARTRRVRLP